MASLKLQIFLDAVDRISKPFRQARQSTDSLRGALSEAAKRVRDLEKQSVQIESFGGLQAKAKANAAALDAAKLRAAELAQKMMAAGGGSKKAAASFAAAQRNVERLRDEGTKISLNLEKVRKSLTDAGIGTDKLSQAQERLKRDLEAARQAVARQGSALDAARAKTEALAKARNRLAATKDLSRKIALGGGAAMVGGGASMAIGSRVAGAGINFEESMSAVGALARLDKTSEAFQALKRQAQELGAATSFSASEAAGGMQFLAMAGFEANDILAAMPGMLDLAKAGNTDLAQTADIASNILSGFGLQASEMSRVGDVLAAAFTRANVNLPMLGESMKYVAPIAKELGTSVEEAAAMAGLLGNVGIQGSQAGTALRALHNRLASPPPNGIKALQTLGVATRTATGDMRSMTEILADVAKATESLGNADRIAAFKAIAGEEAGAAMAQLVAEGGSGALAKYTDILRDSTGEASRIARAMGDNAAGDIKEFGSAIEGLNITLTELNISPIRDLTQTATRAVRAVQGWVQENPRLAAGLTRVAAIVAGLVFLGGTLAIAIAGILGPFAMMRFALTAIGIKAGLLGGGLPVVAAGIKAISAALLANPIGLVVMGIAGAALLIYTFWEPIKGFFTGLWDAVTARFSGAWTVIQTLLSFTPLGLIVAAWEPIQGFFSGLWEGITGMFTAAWDFVMGRLEAVKAPISWLSDKLGGLFGGGNGQVSAVPSSTIAAPPAIQEPRPIRTTAVAAVAAVAATSPVAAAAQAPAPVTQHIQITVNPAPGMDEAALAREVRRQLELAQSRDRAAARNRLYDGTE